MSFQAIIDGHGAFVARIEATLKALEKPTTPSANSLGKYLKANPKFSPASLGKEDKAAYDAVLGVATRQFNTFVEPFLRGGRYLLDDKGNFVVKDGKPVFERYPSGALDMYYQRLVQYWADPLTGLLDKYGDPNTVREFYRVAPLLAMNSVKVYDWPTSKTAKALEQPEVRKYVNFDGKGADGKTRVNGYDGDLRPLDFDLMSETVARFDYVLQSHPEYDYKINSRPEFAQFLKDNPEYREYTAREFYSDFATNHIMKRGLYLSIMYHGSAAAKSLWASVAKLPLRAILDRYREAGIDAPPERYGHTLGHSLKAAEMRHHWRFLTYGWEEDKGSRDRLGKFNQDALDYIATDYGELVTLPHMNAAKAATIGWAAGKGHFDSTYLRERIPRTFWGYRTGNPWCTLREVVGVPRAIVYAVMYEGSRGKWVAGGLGGYSNQASDRGKAQLITRGLKRYKSRYVIGTPAANLNRVEVVRGTVTLGLHLARDADKLRLEVEGMNDQDSVLARGQSLALLYF